MKITEVKIRKALPGSSSIAMASITIDDELVINDIKIYRSNESNNDYKIVFPNNSLAAAHGKRNIVPLTYDVWKKFKMAILSELMQGGNKNV